MAKAMPYSGKYTAEQAKTARMAAVAAKPAPRRTLKIGPLALLGCLALVILILLALPLMVGGAAPASSKLQQVKQAVSEVAPVQQDYPDTQSALTALGVQVALPSLPEGYALTACRVVDDAVLELELTGGKSVVLFRAAAGSEDLSGVDYETYAYTATETVDGVTRGYAGVSEKKLNMAAWVDGDCTYALVSENGMDPDAMRLIAESVG